MSRRVFALIPAAGQSRRMGQMKQLMPYGGGTLLDAVLDAVEEAPIDGVVLVTNPVVAARYEGNRDEMIFIEINSDPNSSMRDSIQLGLARLRDECGLSPTDGIMILPGDQPQIRAGVITTCAESYRGPRKVPPDILIATYGGRRGHPAIFSAAVLRGLADLPVSAGLNELARRRPELVRELPITSAPMPIDVNTPEDFERLNEA